MKEMERLDWVKPYYTRAGEYWGPSDVGVRDTQRVEIAERLRLGSGNRMLELGAGGCQTALAMANSGWDVVAVEFSPTKAEYARETAKQASAGSLTMVEADFYEIDLNERYDMVCYWDGFGVGSDTDQRRLLKRIAGDWLKPEGCALIEVFCPWQWARVVGREERLDRNHPSHRYRQRRTADFDPIASCFIDTWTPIDDSTNEPDESMAITQTIRCYSPADFLLLLESTGLTAEYAEVGGEPFDLAAPGTANHPIWQSWSYLVRVAPAR